jgi:glutathione S-transferase
MLGTVVARLADAPYLLGSAVSAADFLWGLALRWGTMFKIVPEHPVVTAYVARVTGRPSFAKVVAMDAKLGAEQRGSAEGATRIRPGHICLALWND